jgi:hypothetical protein
MNTERTKAKKFTKGLKEQGSQRTMTIKRTKDLGTFLYFRPISIKKGTIKSQRGDFPIKETNITQKER